MKTRVLILFAPMLSVYKFCVTILTVVLFSSISFSFDSMNPLKSELSEFQTSSNLLKDFTKVPVKSSKNISESEEERIKYLTKIIEDGIQAGMKWEEHESQSKKQ